MQELTYFGKEYKKLPTFMHVRSAIRKYLNSGGFYCIALSQKYKNSIISFLDKNYNISDPSKIKSYNIEFILYNIENHSQHRDLVFVLLHPNSLMKKHVIEKYFIDEIKKIYNIDFKIPRRSQSDNNSNETYIENSLISSFDNVQNNFMDNHNGVIVPINKYEKIEEEYLENVIPIIDPEFDINLFYQALCNWCSEEQEIIETVNKGLN